jgi:O-antigen ligase
MNAWRTLMIHGGIWLAVCALWIGITRRRSAQVLLVAIAINGVALAVVAILQRLTESDRLLFFWSAPTPYFVASFIYKNHAGAYLNLILALCLGLAWWHADRAEQRMAKSHPGLLFLFLAVFVAVALLFTYAVAATALGVAFVLTVAIGYVTLRIFHAKHGGSSRSATLLTGGLCAVFLGLCAYSLNIEKVSRKFGRVSDEEYTSSITYRQLATKATFDMGRDELWLGHGIGGYRYVFPRFQQAYPEIFTSRKRRLYWEHAHNDYVEYFAESGVLGLGLLALGSVFVIVGLRRAGVFSQPPGLIVAGGPLLVVVYAAADFPTHNPAVLTTACAILVLTTRWVGLDRPKHARTAGNAES